MKRRLLATAGLLLASTTAYGDSGSMLLHQDAGPFTVTLFAAPQPLRVGTAEISVMVQDRTSGDVLVDPVVDLTLDRQAPVRLTAGRLLQAGSVNLPQAGRSSLILTIQQGHDIAQLKTDCNVEADRSRAALLWFYCLLPVVVIVLFVFHQALKMRSKPHA